MSETIGKGIMKLNPLTITTGFFAFVWILAANLQAQGNDLGAMSGSGQSVNFAHTLNQQVGSMRFAGKVVVAGGKLPWDPIPVVVKCDGKTRLYVLTDKKGGYDIAASPRESEIVKTSRDPEHMDPSQLVGCKVTAILDGFESTTVAIPNGTILENPDLDTIRLRPDERATGFSVSNTTRSAPPEALKEFEEARADRIKRNFGGARRHLQKAVSIDPQFAEAWYQLGKVEETDKPQDALSAYLKAAAADPEYTPPYERIAALAAVEKRWQEVADAANHALQLSPKGTPQIWYFSAVGNLNIGKTDIAETSALTALSMDPGHVAAPKTEQLLAVILARRGEYNGALEHLRNCLTYAAPGPEADLIRKQVAQLEETVSRTVN
jgi:tetratricopeptide (TPR) repeat protein